MLVAVNSKSHKYQPQKYMTKANANELRGRETAPEREAMTGDQVYTRLLAQGLVIDARVN